MSSSPACLVLSHSRMLLWTSITDLWPLLLWLIIGTAQTNRGRFELLPLSIFSVISASPVLSTYFNLRRGAFSSSLCVAVASGRHSELLKTTGVNRPRWRQDRFSNHTNCCLDQRQIRSQDTWRKIQKMIWILVFVFRKTNLELELKTRCCSTEWKDDGELVTLLDDV